MIVAWLVAPEGHDSALADTVLRLSPSVDRLNLVWRKGVLRERWMERVKNLEIAPDGDIDISRLNRTDYCLILKEGLIFPAGYVRRMIAACDDIAITRKIIGVEGVIYSDFFDRRSVSRLVYAAEEPLARHSLVNHLGFEGTIFRPGDIADFSAIDLMAPDASLNLAVQCFRAGVPQICVARGQNWISRHAVNFERADQSWNEEFVRSEQEIAGFGRLPVSCLDDAGRVPTHAPMIPGHLLANEGFRDVVSGANSLERMAQIAPHWFIDFLGSHHEFAVSIAQSANGSGLSIAIDRAARELRLLAPLDPSGVSSRALRVEIVLRGTSREELLPLIHGVYLVAMNESGKPEIISRLFGAIAGENSVRVISAEIKLPRLDPQLDLFFCIQLSNDCKSIDLQSVSLLEIGALSRPRNAGSPQPDGPLRGAPRRTVAVSAPSSAEVGSPMILLNPKSAIVDRWSDKPRMAIVCCSLGQNALGRAYSIGEVASQDFEVELLGALASRHDAQVWAPLRDAPIPIHGFPAGNMASYLSALRALPNGQAYDVIHVSKPRLHSLLLGMVLSARDGCPLMLDVDDLELAFLQNRTPLTFDRLLEEFQSAGPEIDNPAAEIWTRYCDTLARDTDAITVSNEMLSNRFGGVILRHARDEQKFVADETVRADVRRSLGIREKEKIVFFLGTPRGHKGLTRIADSIVRRADPNLTLCVMGLDEPGGELGVLAKQNPALIRVFGAQPYARLPELIQCADAVCLLQDSSSGISAFQTPAKLGEALAMGLPVLVSRVAPFSELIAAGIVIPADTDAELQIALDGICEGRFSLAADRKRRIDYFLSELSIAVNADRLRRALEAARANFPSTSSARLATLRQLAGALRDRFGVDILEGRGGANLHSRTEKVV